jgi:hypothetical protein
MVYVATVLSREVVIMVMVRSSPAHGSKCTHAYQPFLLCSLLFIVLVIGDITVFITSLITAKLYIMGMFNLRFWWFMRGTGARVRFWNDRSAGGPVTH